jgi:hypothetical protein
MPLPFEEHPFTGGALQTNGRIPWFQRFCQPWHERHVLKILYWDMVRQILKHKGHCVIILGGAHDLTDNVRRLGKGNVGLIVVTTRGYQKHAVEE